MLVPRESVENAVVGGPGVNLRHFATLLLGATGDDSSDSLYPSKLIRDAKDALSGSQSVEPASPCEMGGAAAARVSAIVLEAQEGAGVRTARASRHARARIHGSHPARPALQLLAPSFLEAKATEAIRI